MYFLRNTLHEDVISVETSNQKQWRSRRECRIGSTSQIHNIMVYLECPIDTNNLLATFLMDTFMPPSCAYSGRDSMNPDQQVHRSTRINMNSFSALPLQHHHIHMPVFNLFLLWHVTAASTTISCQAPLLRPLPNTHPSAHYILSLLLWITLFRKM